MNPIVKEKIDTPLGTFKSFDNGCVSLDLREDWRNVIHKAFLGEVFEKDGLKGVMYKGEVICAPFYDDVGLMKNPLRLYLVKGDRFDLYEADGSYCTGDYYHENSHFIFKDRKMGWVKDGQLVVSPLYDVVQSWGFLKIFETRDYDKVRYFTKEGREVLTYRRDVYEYFDSPFWMRSDDGEVFCELQCPPVPTLPECNRWNLDVETEVGMDRHIRQYYLNELVNPNDLLPITSRKLKNLTNSFSYEFSAYRLTAKGENPVDELIKRFKKLDIDDNTWYYVIRLTTAKGETIPESQLEKLNNFITKLDEKPLGKVIGVGEDSNLPAGTVSALIITHYNECCFPPEIWYDWIEVCNNGSLSDVIEKDKELYNFTDEYVDDCAKKDFIADCYDAYFSNIRYNPARSWEETVKVLDYVIEKTDVYKYKVRRLIEKIKSSSGAEEEFFMKYLEYILSNGANPNIIRHNKTPLDEVNDKIKNATGKAMKVFFTIRELLIKHGGKTFKDFKEDFFKEKSEFEFTLYLLGQS